MDFEWDEAKRAANLAKHGVDFPAAARVLEGRPLVFEDARQDYGEPRFVALGQLSGRLLVIVFTLRGQAVRVISARKANAREVRLHAQYQARQDGLDEVGRRG